MTETVLRPEQWG